MWEEMGKNILADVKWKATLTDANHQPKTIEFTQTVFTSVKIPKEGGADLESVRKYESAKQDAFQLAKSYELIQRNLTIQPNNDPDIRAQIDALKNNNRISFQKPAGNLQANHKVSDFRVYSGRTEITSSFQTAARTNNFCLEKFREMEANHAPKKIILPEGSSKLAKFEHMQRRGETAETVNSPLRDEYAEYLDSKGRYDYESQEPPEGLPDSPPVIPDELLLQNQGNPVVQNEQREEALVEDNQQAPVQAENPIDEGGCERANYRS